MKVPKLSYAIAVLLAILAGTAVYFYQATADQRALAGKQAVTVLVALRDIPKNTSLSLVQSSGLAKLEAFPSGSVPTDALTGFDSGSLQLVATHGIAPGEVLSQSSFGDPVTSAEGLQIPDGKVAATIDVGEAERMSGFVKPGSQVAIFYTYTDKDTSVSHTRVLLSRVTVLAVGSTTGVGSDQTQAGQPSLITVALSQKEAEQLVLAKKTGDVSLALLGTSTNVLPDMGTSETGIRG